MNAAESKVIDGFFGRSTVRRFDLGARSVSIESRTIFSVYHTIFVYNEKDEVQFGVWEDQGVVEAVFTMLEKLLDEKFAKGHDVRFHIYHPESHFSVQNKIHPDIVRDFLRDLPDLCPAGPLTFVIEYTVK